MSLRDQESFIPGMLGCYNNESAIRMTVIGVKLENFDILIFRYHQYILQIFRILM